MGVLSTNCNGGFASVPRPHAPHVLLIGYLYIHHIHFTVPSTRNKPNVEELARARKALPFSSRKPSVVFIGSFEKNCYEINKRTNFSR